MVELIDATNPKEVCGKFEGKEVVRVLNKCDGGTETCDGEICISAKNGENIEAVLEGIVEVLGVKEFGAGTAVCFTKRQHSLVQRVMATSDKQTAKTAISELLNGEVSV